MQNKQSKAIFCKQSRSYGWAILLQKKLFSNTFVCNPGSNWSVQINPCVFFPIFRIQHTPVEGWLAGAGISSQFSSDKEDPALCFVCGQATSTVRDKDWQGRVATQTLSWALNDPQTWADLFRFPLSLSVSPTPLEQATAAQSTIRFTSHPTNCTVG